MKASFSIRECLLFSIGYSCLIESVRIGIDRLFSGIKRSLHVYIRWKSLLFCNDPSLR
jgi:hypothetical protein